ncbi:MAG: hypothetical protein QOK06_866 [Acidimicrobiaceae bacterium]
MLRTMNFRTKLLGILAVPMIGLLAVTTVAVSDRRAQADESARVRDRIDVVGAAQAMAQQIRIEEGLSGKEVASGDRTVTTDQRAVTDTAISGFKDALANASGAGSTAYDQALARLDTNLKALATYRSSVNLGTDASFFLTGYKNILNNISNLVSTIADETNDPQLSRQTAALAALARASDATASEWAVLQVSFTRGVMAVTESSELKATVTDRERWLGVYEGLANANGLADVRNQTVGDDVQRADAYERRALAAADDPTVHLDGDAAVWEAAMRGRLTGLSDAATHQIAAIDDQAVTIHNIAVDSLRRFLLLAGSAILLSVGLGLLLARAVTQPLGKLTAAAQKLANVQLPGLVSGLRNPNDDDQHYLVATIKPIEIRSKDEIGKLADAFNSVQSVAVDVAAEQADLLRKGISDIFVNLARRNQVLIDRQIEFLDELEAAEDDPDQLGQLYRLDHLATRMRRNAESLLVLAGLEPARKRTRPVALVDVVRAAIGEVEDYARVDLAGFDEVEVTGNAAVDLGHLLAELLENATNFSPPASRVEVDGRATRNGYVVTIIDEGIGMNEEQLAEANVLLASPAPVGLALTRSLGFTVIGRLAARFGVGVRLMASPAGGIAAVVHLPMHLVVDADAPADTSPAAAPEPEPEPELRLVPTMPDPEPEPARAPDVWELEWPDESLEVQQPVAAVPSPFEAPATTFGEAVPQGAQFERGLNDLLSGDEVLGAPVLIEPAVTSSGLMRRVPKRAALDEEQVRPVAESPRPAIAAGRRSPDDVRAMLARYRTGLQRGRTSDAPGTNEEDPA